MQPAFDKHLDQFVCILKVVFRDSGVLVAMVQFGDDVPLQQNEFLVRL